LVLGILVLAFPALAAVHDSFDHGRIRYVEPGASIQRASEPGSEEAVANLPFLPGDRIWTDGNGRVEFQFAGGSLLRLDSRSKLDYVAHEERRDERVVLRMWSGGLFLHAHALRSSPDFAVETPAGVVEVSERGVYRIDVDPDQTQVSVFEGEASLQAERRVRLEAGERVVARGGEVYDAERFHRGEEDDFARWDQERQSEIGLARHAREYLPEDVSPYADEFQAYGTWYHEPEIGYVWRPYVEADWVPYSQGRWIWTAYGWTWVPFEPWGWAPFHYGRWGYAHGLGWYWIPGRAWGPAWVNWAVGREYIGWCPLGWRDRPVLVERWHNHGRAVPRGTTAGAWLYARRSDLGSRDLPRRIAHDHAVRRDLVVVEPARVRLTRDLRLVDAADARAVPRAANEAAATRAVRTKPGPGDTAPELRTDPTTTIPFPTARTRYESERERREREGREGQVERGHGPSRAAGGVPTAAPRAQHAQSEAPPASAAPPPQASRPFPWTARPRPGAADERRERPDDRREEHARQGDRDVMRPVFQPLSRPPAESAPREDSGGWRDRPSRHEDGGNEQRVRPHGGVRPPDGEGRAERGAPRSEPRPMGPPTMRPIAPPRGAGPPQAGAAPPHASGDGEHARRRKDN
jgi:hypothetical protein